MTETSVDERAVLNLLVRAFGALRTIGKDARLEHRPLGPDGGCWDYAWAEAQRGSLHYVEGFVILGQVDGPNVLVLAHAWCEDDTPTGVVVHDVTEGYAGAVQYMGLRVDCSPSGRPALLTEAWDEMRGSVIEACIVNDLTPSQILHVIREAK